MPMRVGVVGAGSWGTTVASLAAHNADTVLWARRPELVAQINDTHINGDYLKDFPLHPELRASTSIDQVVGDADIVVMGVPSHGFRMMLTEVAPHVRPWVPIVSLTKGLEAGTRSRMSEIVHEVLPGHPVGVLTGPNLAKEVLAGQAAAAVVAMVDEYMATELQHVFTTDVFRVYFNHDVIGSEMGGVLKNVIAIASGMADGLGAGDNTRAAVIARGLAEITQLGVAMGGEPMTFAGLAGMGDLIATCISRQSRNRHVGEQLGLGRTIEQVIDEMQQVAEGVKSCATVLELAEEHDCEMPIAREVVAVVHHGRTAAEAYRGLLRRENRHEHHGMVN